MKNKLFLLFFALVLSAMPLLAIADGGIVYKPLPEGDWTWGDEGSQEAFINYENGVEKLIIGVDVKKENSEMAWIVPVPGQPEKIDLDILSGLPTFFGDEVVSRAKTKLSDNLEGPYLFSFLGQGWPVLSGFFIVNMSSAPNGAGSIADGVRGDSVSVASHIEKEGIVSELVTAEDSQAIYGYLSQKGFDLQKNSVPQLDHYIGEEYSFVISWLAPQTSTSTERSQKGIFVSFPTEKIYYPLVLTSVYGEKEMPISIRVAGHVLPDISSELKPYAKVDYFTDRTEQMYGGAAGAMCRSYMDQFKTTMAVFYSSENRYPISAQEMTGEAETLMRKIEGRCPRPVYKSDGENYSLSSDIWMIDSLGYSGNPGENFGVQLLDPSEMQKFYGNTELENGKGEYTKIEINAPAKLLKEDLWMEEGKPFKITAALWVIENAKSFGGLAGYLLITGMLSFFAGGLAGLICYKKFWKYALIGLANIFTLIGLIGVFRSTQARSGGKSRFKIGFELFFSAIFIVLLLLLPVSSAEKPVFAICGLIGIGFLFTILSASGRSADGLLAGSQEAPDGQASITEFLVGKKEEGKGMASVLRGTLSAAYFIAFFVCGWFAIVVLFSFSNLGIFCLMYFLLLLVWHSIRSLLAGKTVKKISRLPMAILLISSLAALFYLARVLSHANYWSFRYFDLSLQGLGITALVLSLAVLWTEFFIKDRKAGEGAPRIIISTLLIIFSTILWMLVENFSLPAFLVIAVSAVLSLILALLDAKSLIRKYKEGEKTKLILAMSLFLVFFIVSLFISFFLLIVVNN